VQPLLCCPEGLSAENENSSATKGGAPFPSPADAGSPLAQSIWSTWNTLNAEVGTRCSCESGTASLWQRRQKRTCGSC
jgi:hypothetical protein